MPAYRTILPWIAHETQYWSFKYIFGTAYSANTEASEISPIHRCPLSFLFFHNNAFQNCRSPREHRVLQPYNGWYIRIAADSTMLRMVNLLIALSLGVHREQLEHRIGLTWPRPFLLRPLQGCQYFSNNSGIASVIILGCSLLDHVGRLCGDAVGLVLSWVGSAIV